MGSPSPGGTMSWPSMRMVGEPGKRSRSACSSESTWRTWTESGSNPSSFRAARRSSSARSYEGQPSHQSSSTVMQLHALDHDWLDRAVALPGLDRLDRVNGLHAGIDPAEHRELA